MYPFMVQLLLMKKTFLCALIILLSQFGDAQDLRIVKDNLNCTYGLKNKSGNWVVDPTYILIEEYNTGYFLAKDALGDGILSPIGTCIVECKYDRIYSTDINWHLFNDYNREKRRITALKGFFFDANLGESKFLLNSRGVAICKMSINDQYTFDGEGHILVNSYSPTITSYIDTTGKILIDQKRGAIFPFEGKEYSLCGDKIESYTKIMNGNVRLINSKGKDVLDVIFDRAMLISDNRICYEKDGRYGVMNITGEEIIRAKYSRQLGLDAPETSGGSWVIYDENKRSGVMKSDGTIIIEPYFDEISPVRYKNSLSDPWKVRLNDKFGIVNSAGIQIIPPEYDKIFPLTILDRNTRVGIRNYMVETGGKFAYVIPDSSVIPAIFYDSIVPIINTNTYSDYVCTGLITKQNGYYGILNTDGSERMESKYKAHFRSEHYYDRQYFSVGKEISEFIFKTEAIQEVSWSLFIEDGDLNYYSNATAFKAFKFSEGRNAIIGLDKEFQNHSQYGDLLVVNPPSPKSWRVYNTFTKQRIPISGIATISPMQGDLYQIRTQKDRAGVIDSKGKLIIDTIYFAINENQNSSAIWAAKRNNANAAKWVLLDSVGRQILPNTFDLPFAINSGDQMITQNNRMGLLDSKNLIWKIRPEYPCLFRLIGDYYYVANLENKKGIVRGDGSIVLQPIYDSIRLLASNCYANGNCAVGFDLEIRWLVNRGKVELIADQDGKLITSYTAVREFKESLLFQDTVFLKNEGPTQNFPMLDYSPSLHFLRNLSLKQIRAKRQALWTNPAIKRSVFDSIEARWQSHRVISHLGYLTYVFSTNQESDKEAQMRRNCECSRSMNAHAMYEPNYQLQSIGNNFASVIKYYNSNDPYGWDHLRSQAPPEAPGGEMWNFVYKKDKVIAISLNDIFPTDALLIQELILAIQKRDDLKLDCSSLEMMVARINGKFTLAEEGVYLYYSGFDNWNAEMIRFLIPAANLETHSETNWIVPILKKSN